MICDNTTKKLIGLSENDIHIVIDREVITGRLIDINLHAKISTFLINKKRVTEKNSNIQILDDNSVKITFGEK